MFVHMTKFNMLNIKIVQHVSKRRHFINSNNQLKYAINDIHVPNKNTNFSHVYKSNHIDWVNSALLKSKLETIFFHTYGVCITFFRINIFSEVNFNTTSPIPKTLVVWKSPNNTFLYLATVYILNIIRS